MQAPSEDPQEVALLDTSDEAFEAQMSAARKLLDRSSPLEAAVALNNAANITRALAERAADPNSVIEAVGLYGQALSLAKRWRSPFLWTAIRLNRARAACAVARMLGSKIPDAALGRERRWLRVALWFSSHWIKFRFGREGWARIDEMLTADETFDRHVAYDLVGPDWRTAPRRVR